MAGAGAPRGHPGERPPSGGGWRTRSSSAGTVGQRDVRGAGRRRPASLASRTAGPRPGRPSATAAGLRRRRPGPDRSETRGTVASLVGYREDLLFAPDGSDAGPAAPHASTPPGRVRALPGKGEPAVGRGENRRASKSVGGRECAVGVSQVAAEVGLQAADVLGGTESSVAVTRGRGRPVSACSGESGGRRPAAGCRGRANSIRSGAGMHPPRRRSGRYGNGLPREPGDRDRRAGAGDPRAGQASGSPRARTSPVATPDPGACGGQPVARECSGGPLGLTPGAATAPRGTGGIHRGPAGAGRRRVSSAAEEDAAG